MAIKADVAQHADEPVKNKSQHGGDRSEKRRCYGRSPPDSATSWFPICFRSRAPAARGASQRTKAGVPAHLAVSPGPCASAASRAAGNAGRGSQARSRWRSPGRAKSFRLGARSIRRALLVHRPRPLGDDEHYSIADRVGDRLDLAVLHPPGRIPGDEAGTLPSGFCAMAGEEGSGGHDELHACARRSLISRATRIAPSARPATSVTSAPRNMSDGIKVSTPATMNSAR